jgi:prephenate dehydratase
MANNDILKIAIQGYPGSFHDEAARKFFMGEEALELKPANTFDILAKELSNQNVDYAVMAIENSIAGTILQNYRILRENNFWIVGETYLWIQHNLLVNPHTKLEDIQKVSSHPMALNQCLDFLNTLPKAALIEHADTALSAIELAENPNPHHACIASLKAAELTGLEVLQESIETNKNNYTRFFILSRTKQPSIYHYNKASVYLRIPDEKGHLLKVLQAIESHDINMSKLQSFPVLGKFREYFFHLDLEFTDIKQYQAIREDLRKLTVEFSELGVYDRADLRDLILINQLIEQ